MSNFENYLTLQIKVSNMYCFAPLFIILTEFDNFKRYTIQKLIVECQLQQQYFNKICEDKLIYTDIKCCEKKKGFRNYFRLTSVIVTYLKVTKIGYN